MSFNWEIALAAQAACILEADAPKPGNVNRYFDFDDATLEDFHLSGLVIGLPFGLVEARGVGETVLESVRARKRFVSTNTNLGILLLLAPLALAWTRICARVDFTGEDNMALWKEETKEVLENLTEDDTAHVYIAIREASPGGLGEVNKYDVNNQTPPITLLEAMREASERDLVASQYTNGFSLILGEGYEYFTTRLKKGYSIPEAVKDLFVYLISLNGDSLIARKLGAERNNEVKQMARLVMEGKVKVKDFDLFLRSESHALNPGTTADLTSAVIFVWFLNMYGGHNND